MNTGSGRGGEGPTILLGSQYERPKSVIEALSELQQYGALLGDEEIPEDFWTLKQSIDFMTVGIKESLKAGLFSVLLMPFSLGVVRKMIPIFGEAEPSLFDKVFAMMLSMGYSLGYAFLVLLVTKYYFGGRIVRKAFRDFLSGLYIGKIGVVVVGFIFYHFVYFMMTKERVAWVLYKLGAQRDLVIKGVIWWENFRSVFLVSSWLLVVIGVLFILIPWVGILWHRFKRRKIAKTV